MHKRLLRWFIVPTALMGLGLLPSTGRADFVFFTNSAAFQAGLTAQGLTDQAVLFNVPGTNPGPAPPAPAVTGLVDTTTQLINFNAMDESPTVAPATGLPRVTTTDSLFGGMTISPAATSSDVTSLSFTLTPGILTLPPAFVLTVTNKSNTATNFMEPTAGTTPLFFGVIATNGQAIAKAVVTGSPNIGEDITDLRGIRVGLGQVPEPASMILAGIGLAAVCVVCASRRRAKASGV